MNKSDNNILQKFKKMYKKYKFSSTLNLALDKLYVMDMDVINASHGYEVDLSSAVFTKVSAQLSIFTYFWALRNADWQLSAWYWCVCVYVCVLQVAEQLMTIAYENGVNLFDTAEVYSAGKWV